MFLEDISETDLFGKDVRVFEVYPETINALYSQNYVDLPDEAPVHPNQPLILKAGQQSALAVVNRARTKLLLADEDITYFAIRGRNKEQVLLQNLFKNPDIRVIVVTGAAGTGKAQPLDANLLTPDGWIQMGDAEVGDEVMTPNGTPASITGVYPQGEKSIYRVHFQDGSSVECCKEHLWYTTTCLDRDKGRPGSVKSLEEIMGTLKYRGVKRNHHVPVTQPLQFEESEIPLDPYLVGCLLGDGCMSSNLRLSTSDEFLVETCNRLLSEKGCRLSHVRGYDYNILAGESGDRPCYSFTAVPENGGETLHFDRLKDLLAAGFTKQVYKALQNDGRYAGYVWSKEVPEEVSAHPVKEALLQLDLWGKTSREKHIPHPYLFGSYQQRLGILRGLMDTDGTVSKGGKNMTFTTISADMVRDFKTLVQSMGGTVSVSERKTAYTHKGVKKQGRTSYRCTLALPNEINPFLLPRKANQVKPRTKYHPRRIIDRVEYVGEKEAQCIKVDHPKHLYLTDDMVATHNTTMIGGYVLHQIMEKQAYKRLLLSKPLEIVTGTRYWGTVPGDEHEKFSPFLKSYQIMFEGLTGEQGGTYVRTAMDRGVIRFFPLELMRGASLKHCIMWFDEAQNLNHHELNTLGSRMDDTGKSKLVLSGDLNQQDRNGMTKSKTGLHKLVTSSYFINSPHTAHVHLIKNERGVISQLFFDVFDREE